MYDIMFFTSRKNLRMKISLFNVMVLLVAARFSYEPGDGDTQGALVASLARGARTVLMIR